MRYLIITVFVIAFIVLNYCLLMPIVNPGLSWQEAGLGILPTAPISLICFILLLFGIGAKSYSSKTILWIMALGWGLIVGSLVILGSRKSEYRAIAMLYGLGVLGFAFIAFIGLIASLLMKKKTVNEVK